MDFDLFNFNITILDLTFAMLGFKSQALEVGVTVALPVSAPVPYRQHVRLSSGFQP